MKVPRELSPPQKKFCRDRKRIVGQNLVYAPDFSDKITKFLDMNQIGQMNQGQIQIHSCQVEYKIISRFLFHLQFTQKMPKKKQDNIILDVSWSQESKKDRENEERSYKEAFDHFDWNKSGTIPTSDLQCAMRRAGQNPTDVEVFLKN